MSELRLDPARTVLVIIDIQERLVAAMSDRSGAVCASRAARLVLGAEALGVPVLVTEQYPRGLGSTVPVVAEAISEHSNARTTEKVEFAATMNGEFTEAFAALGRDQVVLAGMESHICVYQTARGLIDRGASVHIADDATCARESNNQRIARSLWERCGAVQTSTEVVLFDLLGKAGGDAFKKISKLVR